MDNTAVQAGHPPSVYGAGSNGMSPAGAARVPRAPKSIFWRGLQRAADLRITVTLFALSLFLVFYGTLAQVDKGVWTVVAEYFRSPLVWIPLKVVLFRIWDVPGAILYPGGWLLGGLLLVNLLAAHIVSFKVSWKRSGILLIHAGIVIMMLGELITGLFALEGHMHINWKESSNYIEHAHAPELAVVDTIDLKHDHVAVVPTARLRHDRLIVDPQLPFEVEVLEYMVNSALFTQPGAQNRATHGQGLRFSAEARPEGTGVDKEQNVDAASAYIALKHNGRALGTYLVSVHLAQPDEVEVDGKVYQVSLRFKRVYKDYTFRLDKLNIAYYPGTDKPKDYSSYIRLTNPKENEDRDVRIFMNNPLSYGGETFYQSGVSTAGGVRSTTLQVVRNPGWMMPYLSCLMVAGGMLVHFGQNLFRFIERRAL